MAEFECNVKYLDDTDPFISTNYPEPIRPPTYKFYKNVPLLNQLIFVHHLLSAPHKLEDCTLQLYKFNNAQGDFGTYLDMELTISEQWEEFEGFHESSKNAIILRTNLSARVNKIIEKLLNTSNRELRRSLFSLKQIFQDDKDLVHEFVNNKGLDCLIKVGSQRDHNCQNYILRALGQIMLYIDGMNGVILHNCTIQWLYSLLPSKFRLVVKTALKLLLVFVEYSNTNSQLLRVAVEQIHETADCTEWSYFIDILVDKEGTGDTELLIYTMTLINKLLTALPDQDSFYDITDALEAQGIEKALRKYSDKSSASDPDLLEQIRIYETALRIEDGVEIDAKDAVRRGPRKQSELASRGKRTSARHNVMIAPCSQQPPSRTTVEVVETCQTSSSPVEEYSKSDSTEDNSSSRQNDSLKATHRSKAERQKRNRLLQDEQKANEDLRSSDDAFDNNRNDDSAYHSLQKSQNGDMLDETLIESAGNDIAGRTNEPVLEINIDDSCENNQQTAASPNDPNSRLTVSSDETLSTVVVNKSAFGKPNSNKSISKDQTNRSSIEAAFQFLASLTSKDNVDKTKLVENYKSFTQTENYSKDIHKESSQLPSAFKISKFKTPKKTDLTDLNVETARVSSDSREVIGRARSPPLRRPSMISTESISTIISQLDASSSVEKTTTLTPKLSDQVQRGENLRDSEPPKVLTNESATTIQWELLEKTLNRALHIREFDFTDLRDSDEEDPTQPKIEKSSTGLTTCPPPAPPPPLLASSIPPAPPQARPAASSTTNISSKDKRTIKLHWKEIRHNVNQPVTSRAPIKTIWDQILRVKLDNEKFETLFEAKATELKTKKIDLAARKVLHVLDVKRSNAINIGMTVLPPVRSIKYALLKMDASLMNREALEKLLGNMLPTEEEISVISAAQSEQPDTPLGSAEQFLMTLNSVSELKARLQLWLFKLDYETVESEVADPLVDLKTGIAQLRNSNTLRWVLSALLTLGNFLNESACRAFDIEYLTKASEIKDTLHKHSLLYHVAALVSDQFAGSSDLYSEIGSVTRCSRIDWIELDSKLTRLQEDCNRSWDHLRSIAQHETDSQVTHKMTDFLQDAAERIVLLKIIHRRVMNRFRAMLLFFGMSAVEAAKASVRQVCAIFSEFALEYRTAREKVEQLAAKKLQAQERKKTRGKFILEVSQVYKTGGTVTTASAAPTAVDFKSKRNFDEKELHQLLNGEAGMNGSQSTSWSRNRNGRAFNQQSLPRSSTLGLSKSRMSSSVFDLTKDDSEDLLEACLRSAVSSGTEGRRTMPRERHRSVQRDRKSLRRTLRNGISEEDMPNFQTQTAFINQNVT